MDINAKLLSIQAFCDIECKYCPLFNIKGEKCNYFNSTNLSPYNDSIISEDYNILCSSIKGFRLTDYKIKTENQIYDDELKTMQYALNDFCENQKSCTYCPLSKYEKIYNLCIILNKKNVKTNFNLLCTLNRPFREQWTIKN